MADPGVGRDELQRIYDLEQAVRKLQTATFGEGSGGGGSVATHFMCAFGQPSTFWSTSGATNPGNDNAYFTMQFPAQSAGAAGLFNSHGFYVPGEPGWYYIQTGFVLTPISAPANQLTFELCDATFSGPSMTTVGAGPTYSGTNSQQVTYAGIFQLTDPTTGFRPVILSNTGGSTPAPDLDGVWGSYGSFLGWKVG